MGGSCNLFAGGIVVPIMNNIISLFSSRDGADTFEARLAPHIKGLYSQAWRYTGNCEEAEDLLQDLLLELYGKQEQMAQADNLPAWLNRCLYHRFVDRHRRRARAPRLEDVSAKHHQEALAHPDSAESDYMHTQVLRGMAKLNPVQRAVASLHDISGYSLPEIADITNVPLGTLKSHLHRARHRLKSLLELQPFADGQRRVN